MGAWLRVGAWLANVSWVRCVALRWCMAARMHPTTYPLTPHRSPLTLSLQPQPPLGKSSIALKIELQFYQVAELGGELIDALLGGDFAV